MVTRASTRKESTAKTPRKPDAPAEKRPATRGTTEHKPAAARRSGVPPISKARPHPPEVKAGPGAKEAPSLTQGSVSQTPPAKPAPKPETVSLIEEKRPKKSEPTTTTETRSVLPPISKIRPQPISK